MPPKTSHFTPALFQFLRQLAQHNDREWFNANKPRFERDLRDPFLAFIRDIAAPLHKISAEIVADPRPVGGSLFRIHRDTRFSRDKSPYKTHAGAQFRHRASEKDVHGPGFYLHLEPGESFLAGGIWRPEPAALAKIRTFIATNPKAWTAAATRGLVAHGESAKRPPKGFDPDHPLIDEIKRKDFIASLKFTDAEVCSPRFATHFVQAAGKLSPRMAILGKAVGFRW